METFNRWKPGFILYGLLNLLFFGLALLQIGSSSFAYLFNVSPQLFLLGMTIPQYFLLLSFLSFGIAILSISSPSVRMVANLSPKRNQIAYKYNFGFFLIFGFFFLILSVLATREIYLYDLIPVNPFDFIRVFGGIEAIIFLSIFIVWVHKNLKRWPFAIQLRNASIGLLFISFILTLEVTDIFSGGFMQALRFYFLTILLVLVTMSYTMTYRQIIAPEKYVGLTRYDRGYWYLVIFFILATPILTQLRSSEFGIIDIVFMVLVTFNLIFIIIFYSKLPSWFNFKNKAWLGILLLGIIIPHVYIMVEYIQFVGSASNADQDIRFFILFVGYAQMIPYSLATATDWFFDEIKIRAMSSRTGLQQTLPSKSLSLVWEKLDDWEKMKKADTKDVYDNYDQYLAEARQIVNEVIDSGREDMEV